MTEIVDRKAELERLELALGSAYKGKGSTVLIFGEAGIGKSALCNVLSEKAEKMGFQVLRAWCFPEYLKPYLPFEKALKPLNMSHLFEGSAPPRIESVFLIANSGILLTSVERKELEIDGDIFTGMLTAVGHFVKDSLEMMAGEGALNVLGYGGMRIIIERGDVCSIAAVISGRENEFLLEDMKDVLKNVHRDYGEALREWDSDIESIEGAKEIIEPLLKSGKYAGVDYSGADPKLKKGNIMENVSLGLLRNAEKSPILLIIEDLQWADSLSVSLMQYISRNIRSARILVVGTYRSGEARKNSSLSETLRRMNMEDPAIELPLRPLKKDAVLEMVRKRMPDVKNLEVLVKKIFEESGGNPLFVSEMLDMISEEGLTEMDEEGIEGLKTPKKIREMIRNRIKRLSDDELEILEAASVMGQEFTGSILSEMLDRRKIDILKTLKRLERHENLIEKYEGKYRFHNPMVRQVLYEDMGTEIAQAYHEIAALSLEEMYPESPDHSILGYHYYMANIAEKAISHLLKAAEEAKSKYSNEEALKELLHVLEMAKGEKWSAERQKALELLGEIYIVISEYEKAIESLRELEELADDAKRPEILIKISEAYQHMSKYEEALSVLGQAEEMAEGLEMGRIYLSRGNVLYRKGEYDEAMRSFEKSIEYLEKYGTEAGDISTSIRAIGNIYYSRGEYERALRNYEKALDTGDLSGKAMSLNNMGVVHVRLGNYDKAAKYFRDALKIREKIGDRWGTAMFLSNLGVVKSESGEYEAAMDYFKKSLEIRERIGDMWGTAMSLNNIGMIYLEKGEYGRSMEYFRKAMSIREKIEDRGGIASSMISMGMAYIELGDAKKSAELCAEAFGIKEEIGDMEGTAESLNVMGRARAIEGDGKKGIEYLERSLKISEEVENKRMVAYNLCSLSELYLDLGKLKEAEGCSTGMEDMEHLNSREIDAWILRIKGRLAYGRGEKESAESYLKQSVEMYREMGRNGDMAKSLYWLGVVLGEKGIYSMKEALTIFEKGHMRKWVGKVKDFMDGTG